MMRTAPAERQQAEQVLYKEGWTVVTIPKDLMVVVPNSKIVDMTKWCEEHIGAGRIEPGANWLDGYDVWYMFAWYGYWSFYFKREQDATAFALRWR